MESTNIEEPAIAEPEAALPWLIIMMKAPEPGRVKTRLAKSIGDRGAAQLYRRFVEYLLSEIIAAPGTQWRPMIAFAPDHAEAEIRAWLEPLAPEATPFIAQGEGDLGCRLIRVFETAFSQGAPAVAALGTDCVALKPEDLERAFADLRGAPLIMGEAEDGGYWIVGMNAMRSGIFESMPWSEPTLAARTRAKASALGLAIAEQPLNFDIDTVDDLAKLSLELRAHLDIDRVLDDAAAETRSRTNPDR